MADPEPKGNPKHGISGPMSQALPEPLDIQKNAELVEELKKENNYEGQKETEKRIATLKLLSKTTQEFVKEVSRKKGLPPAQVNQFGGRVYPYGSYRLGVFGPGSDIDTLAIAPRHVSRDDFFEYYPGVLKRMVEEELAKESREPPEKRNFCTGITELNPVPQSFMPIIKMVLNGIDIDLNYCSIASLQTIPPKLGLNDNGLLMGLSQIDIRAITGPRVTDEILSLVPEPKTFRTALRAIKLWAQRRGIYANVIGFPGGVAWALLVARVCQFYPHAIGATLVDRFFYIMNSWGWPTPVMLKDIVHPTTAEANQGLKVWNPAIYPGDRRNLMPVITPAFPNMCATYNISKSTKTVVVREIKRASEITQRIFSGKAPWSELFQKHTFFTSDHRYYVAIIASTFSADALKSWAGTVESKVRHFCMKVEEMPTITLARPFNKPIKRVHICANEDQIREVWKGSIKYKVEEANDTESATVNGNGAAGQDPDSRTLYTASFYIGLDAEAKGNLNLVPSFMHFKAQCTQWPEYNSEAHLVNLAVHKNWELPEDLFDTKAGEVRPTKAIKKVGKTLNAGTKLVKNPKPLPKPVKSPNPDSNSTKSPTPEMRLVENSNSEKNSVKTVDGEKKPIRRSINEVEDAQTNGEGTAKRQRLMDPTSLPPPNTTPLPAVTTA